MGPITSSSSVAAAGTTQLGFALQLCTFRYPGRLLRPGEAIPEQALRFVADQLRIEPGTLAAYAARPQTRREQLDALREEFGFRHVRTRTRPRSAGVAAAGCTRHDERSRYRRGADGRVAPTPDRCSWPVGCRTPDRRGPGGRGAACRRPTHHRTCPWNRSMPWMRCSDQRREHP